MKFVLNIVSGLMVLMGLIWILQGTNVVAGVPILSESFMMGRRAWVLNGAVLIVVALLVLAWNNRRRRRR